MNGYQPVNQAVRFHCHGCSKPVTSWLPPDAIMRAIAWCAECIVVGKDQIFQPTPEDIQQIRRLAEGRAHIHNIADRMEAALPPNSDVLNRKRA